MIDQSKPDQMSEARALVDQINLSLRKQVGASVVTIHVDDLSSLTSHITVVMDRTAKTEAERDYNRREAEHLSNVVDRLNAENDRLREALRYYGEGTGDMGEAAREALKGA